MVRPRAYAAPSIQGGTHEATARPRRPRRRLQLRAADPGRTCLDGPGRESHPRADADRRVGHGQVHRPLQRLLPVRLWQLVEEDADPGGPRRLEPRVLRDLPAQRGAAAPDPGEERQGRARSGRPVREQGGRLLRNLHGRAQGGDGLVRRAAGRSAKDRRGARRQGAREGGRAAASDRRARDLRALYQDHVEKMLALAGAPDADAKKQARTVMDIETALARVSIDKVERRDPNKIYHRLERAGLKKTAPHFLWDAYFEEIGAPSVQAINVLTPDFFAGMDKLLAAKGKLNDVKTYLRWTAISAAAPALGQNFVEERFRLTQALTGTKAILPRWKRCVQMTDSALGEALGRSFVVTTIGEDGKRIAKEMVQGIEGAFERNLLQVSWMDDAARAASRDKLRKIDNKIGYPEKWRDYSTMKIGRESLLANVDEAARFETRRDLAKIGKPVDRNEWGMTPPEVNAYYNPSMNEMVFPAGIMQAPFFKTDAPVVTNHGGLGMVMGHELTHGFDDEGRQFDGDGNLHEWWSPEVTKAFEQRAACVADKYDQYVAVDEVHLNGKLTLGENIADIGGLKMSLSALREEQGRSDARTDRDFFVAFAQSWCTNYRPEAARLQAQVNPHSTAQWRVNGPVSDNADFARTFSCKAGSPMNPEKKCAVW